MFALTIKSSVISVKNMLKIKCGKITFNVTGMQGPPFGGQTLGMSTEKLNTKYGEFQQEEKVQRGSVKIDFLKDC